MEVGGATRGQVVWFISMDETYPFARYAEVVGQAALNTQSCIVKVFSWQEGMDDNGGPSSSRIMIPWMLLHHTKDEAIQEYVQHTEEQLIQNTRKWEQTELQEQEALCRPLSKKNSFSSQNTEAGCTERPVLPVTVI